MARFWKWGSAWVPSVRGGLRWPVPVTVPASSAAHHSWMSLWYLCENTFKRRRKILRRMEHGNDRTTRSEHYEVPCSGAGTPLKGLKGLSTTVSSRMSSASSAGMPAVARPPILTRPKQLQLEVSSNTSQCGLRKSCLRARGRWASSWGQPGCWPWPAHHR